MRYVRVTVEPTVDNPDAPPFLVDAIIDEDGAIIGRHALFGASGSFDSSDAYFEPFVLKSDGTVDWGDGFDDVPNERYGTLDLRSGPITLGRVLTFITKNYGVQLYRIAKIVSLPAQT